MKKFLKSFSDAMRGLCYVWTEERNFRIQVFFAIFVVAILSLTDLPLFLVGLAVIAIVLVLSAETVNTAFEDTLNLIDPDYNPAVGRIKDIAAGVVILCVVGALVIAAIISYSFFFF